MDILGFDVLHVAAALVVFSVVSGFIYAPVGKKLSSIKCFGLGFAGTLIVIFAYISLVSGLPYSLFENPVFRRLSLLFLVFLNFFALLLLPLLFLEMDKFEIRFDSYAKALAPWLVAVFAVFLFGTSIW